MSGFATPPDYPLADANEGVVQGSLFDDPTDESSVGGAAPRGANATELPAILSRLAAEHLIRERDSLREEVFSLRAELESAHEARDRAENAERESRILAAELCCAFEDEIAALKTSRDADRKNEPRCETESDSGSDAGADTDTDGIVVRFEPVRRARSS